MKLSLDDKDYIEISIPLQTDFFMEYNKLEHMQMEMKKS